MDVEAEEHMILVRSRFLKIHEVLPSPEEKAEEKTEEEKSEPENILDTKCSEEYSKELLMLYKNELGSLMIRRNTLRMRRLLFDSHMSVECDDNSALDDFLAIPEVESEISGVYRKLAIYSAIERHTTLEKDIEASDHKMSKFLDMLSDRYLVPSPDTPDKTAFVKNVLAEIQGRIRQHDPRFQGHFASHGSAAQSTTIGNSSDMDFLFFMDEIDLASPDFSTERMDQDLNFYQIFFTNTERREEWKDVLDGNALSSTKLHDKFFQLMCMVVGEINLPKNVTHGGFLSPNYSGVRYHQAAVTLVYNWNNEMITIDIVQCLKASPEISNRVFREMSPVLNDLCLHATKEGDWDFKGKLILHPLKEQWLLNPEYLTVQFMENFHDDSPFKRAIRLVKGIKKSYLQVDVPTINESLELLLEELKSVFQVLSIKKTIGVLDEMRKSNDWDIFFLSGKALTEIHGKEMPLDILAVFHECFLQTEVNLFSVDPTVLAFCNEERYQFIEITSCIFFYMLVNILQETTLHGDISEFFRPSRRQEGELVDKLLERYRQHVKNEEYINVPLTGRTEQTEQYVSVAELGVSDMEVIHMSLVDEVVPPITNLQLE